MTATSGVVPVLLVGNFLPRDAGGRSVGQELEIRLRHRGWPVMTTSSCSWRPHRLLDMVATVWRHRKDFAIAQVDVFSGPAFVWAEAVCQTARLAGKPYVLTLHGGGLPLFAERWPARVSRLLRSAAAVTAPTAFLRDQMVRHRSDVHLLPNGLETAAHPFRRRTAPRPHLIWMRAFHDLYRPTRAVETLASVSRSHPDAILTMVGPDKRDGSLARTREAAVRLGVESRVTFLPAVPKSQVPSVLAAADVFLNTTSVDNAPVSVMEAMAGGLCVVSTNVGGLPWMVEDRTDGLLVPPDDPQSMAAAVCEVIDTPGVAARLSENGRRKAEQSDWSVVLPKWTDLFRGLASAARPMTVGEGGRP